MRETTPSPAAHHPLIARSVLQEQDPVFPFFVSSVSAEAAHSGSPHGNSNAMLAAFLESPSPRELGNRGNCAPNAGRTLFPSSTDSEDAVGVEGEAPHVTDSEDAVESENTDRVEEELPPHVFAVRTPSHNRNVRGCSSAINAERRVEDIELRRISEHDDGTPKNTKTNSVAQRAYVDRNTAGGFFAKWTVNRLISAVKAEESGNTFSARMQRLAARFLDCFSWGLNMDRLNTIFGEGANEAARLLNRRVAS